MRLDGQAQKRMDAELRDLILTSSLDDLMETVAEYPDLVVDVGRALWASGGPATAGKFHRPPASPRPEIGDDRK